MKTSGYPEERNGGNGQGWRLALWGIAGVLLVLPAVAMQFTSAFAWGLEDLVAAALLIGGFGLAAELAVRVLRTPAQRYAAIAVAFILALVVWAELAVGLFD
jgi:hypothetical protein